MIYRGNEITVLEAKCDWMVTTALAALEVPDTPANSSETLLSFDQAHLLILRLAPASPLWRHVNAILFLLVSLLLCLVHRRWLVLGWRIDGVQDQWIGPSVDELMLGSCWDYDQVSSLDVLILACNGRFARPRREGEDLINSVFLHVISGNHINRGANVVLPRHQFPHLLVLS